MAASRPAWLADLSRSFKRHRHGRPGWFIEVHRDRLRVRSDQLPQRPEGNGSRLQAVTLRTPPGPANAAQALREACDLFDQVEVGAWRWPDPHTIPSSEQEGRLAPEVLDRLIEKLRGRLVGEQVSERTWERMYRPFYSRLLEDVRTRRWEEDFPLLEATLRRWEPNTRSRQMAHDRLKALWREASWTWPDEIVALRGNGRSAAPAEGVRAFNDDEIEELRARILRSRRLTAADLVAWDLLTVFGLRPVELQGLALEMDDNGVLLARVTRVKRSSRGESGPRVIPAVPPAWWNADVFDLFARWRQNGIPAGLLEAVSPGEKLTQQLRRLQAQTPIRTTLPRELTSYGLRHAFALRLGIELGLSVREAAELMGHSPQVHLSTYGRRLDQPRLQAKVQHLVSRRIMELEARNCSIKQRL